MPRSQGTSKYTGPHWEHLVALPKGDPVRVKGKKSHSLETWRKRVGKRGGPQTAKETLCKGLSFHPHSPLKQLC